MGFDSPHLHLYFSHFHNILLDNELEAISEVGELFEGVEELLDNLRFNDFEMAICSNGCEEYINLILNKCNISGYFNYIKGRHPDKSKSQLTAHLLEETKADFAILVGDKATDMKAAGDNNLPFIGV
jgi:adenosylhomocysteine nucleosidase